MGKLYGYTGEIREMLRGIKGAILSVLIVEIHQHIAMHAVGRQQNQNHEVGDQQCHVKGVGVVQALECGIEDNAAIVLPDAPRATNAATAKVKEGNARG